MKAKLKILLQWLSALIMLPFTVLFFLLSLCVGKDESLSTLSQLLSLLPGKAGCFLRAGFYRFSLGNCDPSVVISFGTIFSQADTEIAKGVYIGPHCNIGLCVINEGTLIGSGVHIMSGKHQHSFSDLDTPIREQGGHFEKISIGDNCWIGNSALIMAPVGKRAVIAAGSVVNTDVESATIVGGNPAKLIKNLR